MPPIPVYSSSPISAAKAAGVTPQTAAPGQPAPPSAAAATTTTQGGDHAYPPAQPGARPSLPVPTGVPGPGPAASEVLQPTPTQSLETTGPPAPQPGSVPVAPGAAKHLPPPPKAGETLQTQAQVQGQEPPTSALPMPAQMSYQPPEPSFASYGGSSTSTLPPPAQTGSGPRPVQLGAVGSLSHPPGYQQDIHAAEFSSHQRAAHNASLAETSDGTPSYVEGGEKVWDAAKKWATAAGETLAAAENEIWKRVNK